MRDDGNYMTVDTASSSYKSHHHLGFSLRRKSADGELQDLRLQSGDNTGLVLSIRVDIVVRKGVALAVDLVLVKDARVVVGRVHSVVTATGERRLHVAAVKEQSCAEESSTQSRDNCPVNIVVDGLDAEGTRVAAPDIGDSGSRVSAVVPGAGELVAVDAASNTSCGSLSVDGKILVSVLLPDLLNVVVVVGGLGGWVDGLV